MTLYMGLLYVIFHFLVRNIGCEIDKAIKKTRGRIARAAPATSQTILHIVLHWGFPGFTHVKPP